MDFHALQQRLFELDPSDPREDLAKLTAQAQGGAVADVPVTKDYVKESVEVRPGTLDVGTNSLSDFAALAGVRTSASRPIVAETVVPTLGYAEGIDDKDARIAMLEERVARLEEMLEAKLTMPKQPNPVAKNMNKFNKASVVPNKKKDDKQGYQKHKSKEYESSNIKDRLFAELAKYELKK